MVDGMHVSGGHPDLVRDLGERIADYVETARDYGEWSKRDVMIEAVRIACDDAANDTRRLIERGEPRMAHVDVRPISGDVVAVLRELADEYERIATEHPTVVVLHMPLIRAREVLSQLDVSADQPNTGERWVRCAECKGTGQVHIGSGGLMPGPVSCSDCGGTGRLDRTAVSGAQPQTIGDLCFHSMVRDDCLSCLQGAILRLRAEVERQKQERDEYARSLRPGIKALQREVEVWRSAVKDGTEHTIERLHDEVERLRAAVSDHRRNKLDAEADAFGQD
jgi:hypothetical protein